MTARSAGLLLWRGEAGAREVWIAHMGGPFWARKHDRAWSIPKGEHGDDEHPLAAAKREFAEELGVPAPERDYVLLGEYRYSSGKRLTVYAADGTGFEPPRLDPGLFELEWPPRSGQRRSFPEIDEARWVALEDARRLLVAGQVPMLDDLP